jgi:hypothetical protein
MGIALLMYLIFTVKIGRNASEMLALLTLPYGEYTRARSSVVVKALCYKPEGHGFETRLGE